MELNETNTPNNFIQDIITDDLAAGRVKKVHTRFPPEPNGYLHIGHAKSVCLNFGLARGNGGITNLRFDDTNPVKEDTEYVDSIMEDVKWLGFTWDDRLFYASDYFDRLYACAEKLIADGKAYVCDLSAEEVRELRGTMTEPGKNSPYRDRSVEENMDLFSRMKAGECKEGTRTLRAKIDMASPNINMRDPVIYRIMHADHHRTGDKWRIYPMYDFAHPLSDAFENITHSVCTLEFADHRPLYDWVLDQFDWPEGRPHQIEFARLNLTYTVMSKRKLRALVEEGFVSGWDDPRMPTLSGLRRRGYTPASIRDFCDRIGVAKRGSMVDLALLEHCIREDLNANAARAMAVLRPIKLVLENYPADQSEVVEVENNPEKPETGSRQMTFSRELYIEAEDFMEDPPKKFFRLFPGGEVRLKGAYIIKCNEVVKDSEGNIVELKCEYDPESKSGMPGADRKVKGTLHWVDAKTAIDAEVRVYETLFMSENPEEAEGSDFRTDINPNSLEVLTGCKLEASLAAASKGDSFQFLRQGYFNVDCDSAPDKLVFNRIVSLKDAWAKMNKK